MSSIGGSVSALVGKIPASVRIIAVVALAAGAVVVPVVTNGSGGGVTCDRSAATGSSLTTQFSAATAGQTICLTASVDYGTFAAGAKSSPGVVVTPDSGVNAIMRFVWSGATNTTVDGTLGGGTLTTGTTGANTLGGALAGDALRNVVMRRELEVDKSGTGSVTLDGLTFGGATYSTTSNSEHMIGLYGDGTNGKLVNSTLTGFTVSGNLSPDGIRADGDNWTIGGDGEGNVLKFFKQQDDANHTDPIQMCCGGGVSGNGNNDGPTNNDIIGNYFDQGTFPSSYVSGIIGVHDSAAGIDVRDNVFTGTGTDYSIYLRSCTNCTVDHNIFKRGTCGNFNFECGRFDVTNKSGDNAPSNFVISNNVMSTADGGTGTGMTMHHNLQTSAQSGTGNVSGTPTLVGGSNPTTRAGFCLASGTGFTASSTGGPVGILVGC